MARGALKAVADVRTGVVEIPKVVNIVSAVTGAGLESTGPFDMGENDPAVVDGIALVLILHPLAAGNGVGMTVNRHRLVACKRVSPIPFSQRAVRSHLAGPAFVRIGLVKLVFESADGGGAVVAGFGNDGGAAMLMARNIPFQTGKDPFIRIKASRVENILVGVLTQALPTPHVTGGGVVALDGVGWVLGWVEPTDTLSIPIPAAAMLRIGPPVQSVFIVFFHDEIKGGAAVGVIGVLVEITGQPFALIKNPALETGRTLDRDRFI